MRKMSGLVEGRWVAKFEDDGWLSLREMGGLIMGEMGG